MRRTVARTLAAAVTVGIALLVAAGPAAACGGLVGENGTIQLQRTTTLAVYVDGVEHYVTSFEFTGQGEEVGSIIPLPGVPTSVERAGDWTLQRLQQEVAPPLRFESAAGAATADSAEVLLETKIDALEITILKGGADEVGTWAIEHGFLLTPDAPEVLEFYAERSPIFMAARFDASTATELGQTGGDGTPIHLTIPTDQPWVHLRILGLGLGAGAFVDADVFMLTEREPELLLGTGTDLVRSERASQLLLDDLRSDTGSEWVPERAWLSYLQVRTDASTLTYDLAASVRPSESPSLVDAGRLSPDAAVAPDVADDLRDGLSGRGGGMSAATLVAILAGGGAVILFAAWLASGRRTGER